MTTDESIASARSKFRQTLVRVMTVQVVTLVVLWVLQTRYNS